MNSNLSFICLVYLISSCNRTGTDSETEKSNSNSVVSPCSGEKNAHADSVQELQKLRKEFDAADKEYVVAFDKVTAAVAAKRKNTYAQTMHENTADGDLNSDQQWVDKTTGFANEQEQIIAFAKIRATANSKLVKVKTEYDKELTYFQRTDKLLKDCEAQQLALKNIGKQGGAKPSVTPKETIVNRQTVSEPLPKNTSPEPAANSEAECSGNEDSFRYTHEVSNKGIVIRNTATNDDGSIATDYNVKACKRVALVCNEGHFIRQNGFIKLSFTYDQNGTRSGFIGKYIYAGQLSPTPNPECLTND